MRAEPGSSDGVDVRLAGIDAGMDPRGVSASPSPSRSRSSSVKLRPVGGSPKESVGREKRRAAGFGAGAGAEVGRSSESPSVENATSSRICLMSSDSSSGSSKAGGGPTRIAPSEGRGAMVRAPRR